MNDTIFEILIYSCTQDEFVTRITEAADKNMAIVPDYGTGFWQEQRQDEINRNLKPIRYNELIGGIEVHPLGTQLRADYWFTNKNRIVINSNTKGLIKWCGKLLETHYERSQLSSQQIYEDFRGALVREIEKSARLRKRYVDFEAFDRCAPFVNWRGLLGLPPL